MDTANLIFFEMLGGLEERYRAIKEGDNGESIGLAKRARDASNDITNPSLAFHFNNLHFLQRETKTDTDGMTVVFRASTYAQFYGTWRHLKKNGDKDASVVPWLNSHGPRPQGRKNAAWLKDLVCQEMNMSRKEFTAMIQNCRLPYLLDKTFGPCAAVFATKNFTKYVYPFN